MGVWNDVRQAARVIRRETGFAAVAILTVALGIGANTAIFSIVNGVLLKPLPFHEPDRLVSLREVLPAMAIQYPTLPVSARHFMEWRQRTTSLDQLSAMQSGTVTLTGGPDAVQLDMVRVSANMFQTLGVRPSLGRAFVAGEDQEGAPLVAILSHSAWLTRFHADPAIVGRNIQLDRRPYTVVGVLPPWFRSPSLRIMELGKSDIGTPELFLPLAFSKEEMGVLMGRFNYNVIGRMKQGVPPARATTELNVVAGQLVKLSGEKVELRASVTPLLDAMVGHSRRGLLVLLGAVLAVLLLVCVNLANLMLARAEKQSQETAIRAALASPGRLIAHALVQSSLIALVGGALGVALAAASLSALVRSAPVDIARLDEVRLDLRALAFAFVVSAASGLLFGLAPAWRAAHSDPQTALRAGGRGATGARAGLRLRNILVTAEVGGSAVLLVTAALLMTSFLRVMGVDKGFHAPTVLSAELQIPSSTYAEKAQRNDFHRRLLARLGDEPGVVSAAINTALPLQGEIWIDTVAVPGDARPEWQKTTVNVRFVSPDYFHTMGIPLLAGRTLRDSDTPKQVIISGTLARILWPGQGAVGRQLIDGDEAREVIGVAGDVRAEPDKPPVPMVYRPYWDWAPRSVIVVARAAGDPRSIAGAIRSALRDVDPAVPLMRVRTMQAVLDESVAQRRFQMLLALTFALSALALASIGTWGVVSCSVARRTREMGVRMALGAQPRNVYGLILRQVMKPIALGLAAGLAAALAAGRILESLLYGVSPHDVPTIGAVAAVLALVGLTACALPVRRALRADPLTALRNE